MTALRYDPESGHIRDAEKHLVVILLSPYRLADPTLGHLMAAAPEMREALKEIAAGCIARRPGHCDVHLNRTKAEIEAIARAALAHADGGTR